MPKTEKIEVEESFYQAKPLDRFEYIRIQSEAEDIARRRGNFDEAEACYQRRRSPPHSDRPKTKRDPIMAISSIRLRNAAEVLRAGVESSSTGRDVATATPPGVNDSEDRGDLRMPLPTDPINRWHKAPLTQNADGSKRECPPTFAPKSRPKQRAGRRSPPQWVEDRLERAELRNKRNQKLWQVFFSQIGTIKMKSVLQCVILDRMPFRVAAQELGLSTGGKVTKSIKLALECGLEAVADEIEQGWIDEGTQIT